MVFSSVTFLFFFLPLVLLVHFFTPRRFRNLFLLLVSLFFYAWGEKFFVFIMLISVAANYLFGRLLAGLERKSPEAKRVVALSVVLNLGLLFFYKYANFVVENVNLVLASLNLPAIVLDPVHLPIGISFFTFQAMSYVIDVYRGGVPAAKRPVNVALYISLFPQLIAGPIIRYRDVSDQLLKRTIDLDGFAYGIRRFVVGLAKKVLIANTLGAVVDQIDSIPVGHVPTPVAWAYAFLFALQLYYDFAGYSDMAIGLGRMFGFRFMENFNYPFISKTITEFWQRWHISLSTWFRDYLFNSLGGYRKGKGRAALNLMVVFFLCGLWHGASWNFVLFGASMGVLLAFERIIRARRLAFFNGLPGHVYMLSMYAFHMVLFRAENLTAAWSFMKAMVGVVDVRDPAYHVGLYLNNELLIAVVAAVIGSVPVVPWLAKTYRAWRSSREDSAVGLAGDVGYQAASLVLLSVLFVFCAMKLAAETHNPFIYFRF